MTPAIYRALTWAAGPAIAALLAWRRRAGKEEPGRIGERLGRPSHARPEGRLVWLHGASVGEAQSALALIEALAARAPDLAILVTTGTVTSARLMAERLPPRALHQYVPADRPGAVDSFLAHWRPDLALWLESELWPNLVLGTAARGVPLVLVNARMSRRSYAGWRRWPGLIRPMLESFTLILAQSETDAARYAALGAPRLRAVGSLKFDAAPLPCDEAELQRLEARLGGRPRWLLASTHAGEERIAAAAHDALQTRFRGLLTIIAPRHPARGPAIAAELAGSGLAVARRGAGEPIAPGTDIYLADTMGELGLFYRLAPIVFVGGSLVPHGGQNLLEPARLGCALLHGPAIGNFREIAAALDSAGAAIEVRDSDALAIEAARLLADDALARRRGKAALAMAEAGRGVLDRVLAELDPFLRPLGAAAPPAREPGLAHA